MNERSDGTDSGPEANISERIDRIIALKKAENEQAIGRLDTVETSWQPVNSELSSQLNEEVSRSGDETESIARAKLSLERNLFTEVATDAVGIAGKVIDRESKAGLPGLNVRMAPPRADTAKIAYLAEAKTDRYGNFNIVLAVKDLPGVSAERLVETARAGAQMRFDVLSPRDELVYSETVTLTAEAGRVQPVTLAVSAADKLAGALEYAKSVRASIEADEQLVARRTANMTAAVDAFQRLPETMLLRIADLKEELSVPPPKIAVAIPVESATAAAVQATRYLGNANTHELHDLENEKPECLISRIRWDHRVPFETEQQAVDAGYDYCAYCFPKGKSKR